MTAREIVAFIKESVSYQNWYFYVSEDPLYVQVRFAVNNGEVCYGRKWNLSVHMTRSEIVQTCLKAVLTAEEHEAREHFKLHGVAVFGPHIDVYELLAVCRKVDVRDA